MTGRFLGLSESGLLLEVVERQPSVIPANQVMVLHERRQAWRKGLWIGAGAGVVVGALIGAWSAGFSPLDDPAETALVGGFVCGLIGGVLGVAVGSAITEWHLLYPMDAP